MQTAVCCLNEKLVPAEGFSELPDHAGVELAFMSFLCQTTASSMTENDNQTFEINKNKQLRFFNQHVSPWIKHFADRLSDQADTVLYKCVGYFLKTFIQDEEQLLSQD